MGLDNPIHIAFLVVILLLVFGAKRLPEMGRSLGGGMREFKEGLSGEEKQPTITAAAAQPQQAVPPAAQAAAPAPAPVESAQQATPTPQA
jgi:sec-independent protein translocase protein TatA